MPLKISILYGSVRTERLGIKAARWLTEVITTKGHEAKLIDPLEYNLPLLDKRFKEFELGLAPTNLTELSNIFRAADAFVIVSGEYNHSVPPALKNLIDHFNAPEFEYRPVAIVTYSNGSFGGIRPTEHLREIMSDLGAVTIPAIMPIPNIQDVFDADGKLLDAKYTERADKLLNQLEWYATALKEQRGKGLPS
ncbi:NAD(P)H-dependent oxidoreductase [Candidatus Falkowbacteria bacterium]|nr:NAD(P)H-dependent oxidoreductase [Candidatus Falkowbacteria bacterium]